MSHTPKNIDAFLVQHGLQGFEVAPAPGIEVSLYRSWGAALTGDVKISGAALTRDEPSDTDSGSLFRDLVELINPPDLTRLAPAVSRHFKELSRWLENNMSITIDVNKDALRLVHGHRYLALQGNSEAVVDWGTNFIELDLRLATTQTFMLLHENGGAHFEIGKEFKPTRMVKPGLAWPVLDPILAAVRTDGVLHQALKELQLDDDSNIARAFAVALAARHADVLDPATAFALLQKGQQAPHEAQALGWYFSLTGKQLRMVEERALERLRNVQDRLQSLMDHVVFDRAFEQDVAFIARERVVIDAVMMMLSWLGVTYEALSAVAGVVDGLAEMLVTTTPRLPSLKEDVLLRRSRDSDPETWWGRLVP